MSFLYGGQITHQPIKNVLHLKRAGHGDEEHDNSSTEGIHHNPAKQERISAVHGISHGGSGKCCDKYQNQKASCKRENCNSREIGEADQHRQDSTNCRTSGYAKDVRFCQGVAQQGLEYQSAKCEGAANEGGKNYPGQPYLPYDGCSN